MKKKLLIIAMLMMSLLLCFGLAACELEHKHTYAKEWEHDDTYHWRKATCEHTELITDKEEHSFIDGVCWVCGALDEISQQDTAPNMTCELNADRTGYVLQRISSSLRADPLYVNTYQNLPIIGIADGAFSERTNIKSVVIGNSVVSIGEKAFADSSVTSITLTAVKSIGANAFANCTRLTEVIFCDKVESIGASAFSGCENLEKIEIPNADSWVGISFANTDSVPFAHAKELIINGKTNSDVVLGESVLQIHSNAFYGCKLIKSVTLPANIIDIGENAFFGCDGLNKVDFNGDLSAWSQIFFANEYSNPLSLAKKLYINGKEITEINLDVITIHDYVFYNFEALKSVSLSDLLTNIGGFAFYGCTGLQSINIPKLVTNIGQGAFSGCANLSVTVDSDNELYSIENNCIVMTTGSRKTVVTGFKNNTLAKDSDVQAIKDYAFYGCTGITNVIIPDKVTNVGKYAFANSSIESIQIGSGVKNISEAMFADCTELKSISIPNTVTSIEKNAFKNCSGMTELTMGTGLTTIADYAFYGCAGITNADIPSKTTSVGKYAFASCSALESVQIGSGIQSISEAMFADCIGLKSVSIPNTVTSIEKDAFKNCIGLTELNIGYGVSSIVDGAFYGSKSLESISVSAGNNTYKSVGNSVIHKATLKLVLGCKNTQISNNEADVIAIGSQAFSGLDIEEITIPVNIKTIGSKAFNDCVKLTKVEYLGTMLDWDKCSIDSDWIVNSPDYVLHCTDGNYEF